jgi:ribosome biogenesis GTPase
VAKKKKVRVAFKKNRQKRTRANDLTRRYGAQGDAAESASGERVRAKGELSRHRTIVQEETEGAAASGDDPAASLAIDLAECLPGRVVRIHGLYSIVEMDDGRTFRCGVRRLLKTLAIDGRNVVAVGDRVWIRPGGADEGLIEKVEARRGTITRAYRHREHVIVANVDQLLIVSALAEPGLKLPLIDRYLISAEKGGVRPVIVLNKVDLVDLADYQWVVGLYTQLGYETIPTSAADGRGIDRLKELLGRGATAFSGQSGVGKSSLLNAIEPGLNLRVREVSDWTFKGKHTTTNAELIRLGPGGYVVDTPGLRQFELWDVEPAEVEGYFVEFRPYIPLCKFPDCSHTHETGCAVKDAVHWGQIDGGRYASYLKIYYQQPIEGD